MINRKQALLAYCLGKPLVDPPSHIKLSAEEKEMWNAIVKNIDNLQSHHCFLVEIFAHSLHWYKGRHDYLLDRFNEMESAKPGTGPLAYLANDADLTSLYPDRHPLFTMQIEDEPFIEDCFNDLGATNEQRQAIYDAIGIGKTTADMELEIAAYLQ